MVAFQDSIRELYSARYHALFKLGLKSSGKVTLWNKDSYGSFTKNASRPY